MMVVWTDADRMSSVGRKLKLWIEGRQEELMRKGIVRKEADPMKGLVAHAELHGRFMELERLKKEFVVGPKTDEVDGPAFNEDHVGPQM